MKNNGLDVTVEKADRALEVMWRYVCPSAGPPVSAISAEGALSTLARAVREWERLQRALEGEPEMEMEVA